MYKFIALLPMFVLVISLPSKASAATCSELMAKAISECNKDRNSQACKAATKAHADQCKKNKKKK